MPNGKISTIGPRRQAIPPETGRETQIPDNLQNRLEIPFCF